MKNKQQILTELEAAIDRADMSEIDRGLDDLSSVETQTIEAEDARLFSARILKQSEEKHSMKRTRTPIKIIAIAAAIIAMGLTVYATTFGLNVFIFERDGTLAIFHTTEPEFEFRGERIPEEYLENAEFITEMEIPDMMYFDSVAQAEAALEMPIALPAAMPQMEVNNISGMKLEHYGGAGSRTAWVDFGDDAGRLLGVVVARNIIAPGQPFTMGMITDMDDGSLGSFTNAAGVEFTTITETEDSGEQRVAFIAIASLSGGEFQYAIAFHGFDQAEREYILGSLDLSVYR